MILDQDINAKDKNARQENWQEPNFLQSFLYGYSRFSNNRANKSKTGQHIQVGNACISDLDRGTALLGNVTEEVWQDIESHFVRDESIDNFKNNYEILDDFYSNISDYFLSNKVFLIRDLETLSIEQLRSLFTLIVRDRVLGIKVIIGMTDVDLDNDSRQSRMIEQIVFSCFNHVIFNCNSSITQRLSNIFGHRSFNKPHVSPDQISSLPDNYFWLSNSRRLMQASSPILCKFC